MPVVAPSKTPERIRTASVSRRWVVWRVLPGRRRSRSGWMSSSPSGSPGGQPSMTQPIAAPWLSPQVVTRNALPMVFPGIGRFYGTTSMNASENDDNKHTLCII